MRNGACRQANRTSENIKTGIMPPDARRKKQRAATLTGKGSFSFHGAEGEIRVNDITA